MCGHFKLLIRVTKTHKHKAIEIALDKFLQTLGPLWFCISSSGSAIVCAIEHYVQTTYKCVMLFEKELICVEDKLDENERSNLRYVLFFP